MVSKMGTKAIVNMFFGEDGFAGKEFDVNA